MSKPLTVFLPSSGGAHTQSILAQLQQSPLVESIWLLSLGSDGEAFPGVRRLKVSSLYGSQAIQAIARHAWTTHTLLVLHNTGFEIGQFALERFLSVAKLTGSGLVYSDYWDLAGGKRTPHPLIDYRAGSIRDDFNFGSVLLVNTGALKAAARSMPRKPLSYAGLYSVRLAISRRLPVTRIAEFLYAKGEPDTRKSGEAQFDYVDPRNRAVQIEMEQVATEHLQRIGAHLKPRFKSPNLKAEPFQHEASVLIPVKNRVKTIGDAVASVLNQKTDFRFNLLVIDNHSSDGTTDLLRSVAGQDSRLVHAIPTREDLLIGGCWNEGVHHPSCGRFVVQLDSDDIYRDEMTLQRVIDVFNREKCAMVIGSYRMTNFNLEEIPPGVIDHQEWTPENGRNNALRINGLGAPRAFYTPIVRGIKFPNVSYGEDYAVALAVSREYQIARIFEPIYLCRRWEGNSDANLDVARQNAFNAYKDQLRTLEILARRQLNGRMSVHPRTPKAGGARNRQGRRARR
jgi:glycosyltransferase involved in cell wall biosynthesis